MISFRKISGISDYLKEYNNPDFVLNMKFIWDDLSDEDETDYSLTINDADMEIVEEDQEGNYLELIDSARKDWDKVFDDSGWRRGQDRHGNDGYEFLGIQISDGRVEEHLNYWAEKFISVSSYATNVLSITKQRGRNNDQNIYHMIIGMRKP